MSFAGRRASVTRPRCRPGGDPSGTAARGGSAQSRTAFFVAVFFWGRGGRGLSWGVVGSSSSVEGVDEAAALRGRDGGSRGGRLPGGMEGDSVEAGNSRGGGRGERSAAVPGCRHGGEPKLSQFPGSATRESEIESALRRAGHSVAVRSVGMLASTASQIAGVRVVARAQRKVLI